jgi:WD40 repeat protein
MLTTTEGTYKKKPKFSIVLTIIKGMNTDWMTRMSQSNGNNIPQDAHVQDTQFINPLQSSLSNNHNQQQQPMNQQPMNQQQQQPMNQQPMNQQPINQQPINQQPINQQQEKQDQQQQQEKVEQQNYHQDLCTMNMAQQSTVRNTKRTITFALSSPVTTISSDTIKNYKDLEQLYYPPRQAITKLSTPYSCHIGTPIVTTNEYMLWGTPAGPLRIFHKMSTKKGLLKKHKGPVLDIKPMQIKDPANYQQIPIFLSVGSQDGSIICWLVKEKKDDSQDNLEGRILFRICRQGMFRKALYSQRVQRVFALTDDGSIIHFNVKKCLSKDILIENDAQFLASDANKEYEIEKLTLPMILENSELEVRPKDYHDEENMKDQIIDVTLSKDEQNLFVLTHDATVVVYNWKTRLVLQTLQVKTTEEEGNNQGSASSEPFTINLHENIIVVGFDQNTTFAIVDVSNPSQRLVVHLPHENNESYHIHVTHHLSYMIICNQNGDSCYIYDFNNPNSLMLIGIEGGVLSCVAEFKANMLGIYCLQPFGTSLVQFSISATAGAVPTPSAVSPTVEMPKEDQIQKQQLETPSSLLHEPSAVERLNAADLEQALLDQRQASSTKSGQASPNQRLSPKQPLPEAQPIILQKEQQKKDTTPTSTDRQQQQQQQKSKSKEVQLQRNHRKSPENVPRSQKGDEYISKSELVEALNAFEHRLVNNMSQLMGQYFLQIQQFYQQTIDITNKQQIELLKTVSSSLTNELPEDLCEMMKQEIVPMIQPKTKDTGSDNLQRTDMINKAVETGLSRVCKKEILPALQNMSNRLISEISRIAANAQTSTSVSQTSSAEQLKQEVDNLVAQGSFAKALGKALSGSNLSVLMYLLPKMKTNVSAELEQHVLLSLIQQLAYDLSLDKHLSMKIDWLEQSALHLDPQNSIVIYHGADILRSVLINLCSAVREIEKNISEKKGDLLSIEKRMKLMMHVVQNILLEIESKHAERYGNL